MSLGFQRKPTIHSVYRLDNNVICIDNNVICTDPSIEIVTAIFPTSCVLLTTNGISGFGILGVDSLYISVLVKLQCAARFGNMNCGISRVLNLV